MKQEIVSKVWGAICDQYGYSKLLTPHEVKMFLPFSTGGTILIVIDVPDAHGLGIFRYGVKWHQSTDKGDFYEKYVYA